MVVGCSQSFLRTELEFVLENPPKDFPSLKSQRKMESQRERGRQTHHDRLKEMEGNGPSIAGCFSGRPMR